MRQLNHQETHTKKTKGTINYKSVEGINIYLVYSDPSNNKELPFVDMIQLLAKDLNRKSCGCNNQCIIVRL